MDKIIEEVIEQTPVVIKRIQQALPKKFPDHIAIPILEGLESQVAKLKIDQTS